MNFEKGIALYKEGDFETALEVFQKLTREEHGNPNFHLFRGRTLTRLGKGIEALADFDILVQLEPYNTDFMSDRGVVLHLLGRDEEALTELDRAANLDPKNPYRYSSRAYLKDRIGDFLGSISDYEKAIELDPEDAVAFNNLGLVEEKLGRKEKAQDYFQKADILSGYPKKKEANEASIAKPIHHKKSKETRPKSISPSLKLTASDFVTTLNGIFSKAEIRQEFTSFIKGLFVKKGPKKS
ncbi:MAG: tetratricopeptide repeat protein [Bacteroidetes bacterium]|nr:tetratricopeptide repeat protein [Bacteroidota bacterium]